MQAIYENRLEKISCRNDDSFSLQCNPHLHYSVEIALIYSGKTEVKVDNNTSEYACESDVILVFPNQVHAFTTEQKEKHILFIIDPSLFPEYSSIFSEHLPESNIVKGALKNGELLSMAENICKLYADKENPYRSAALRGYFLAFIGKLFAMAKFKKVSTNDMHAIGYVMNYCALNYRKNLSLDLLEKELHISKYHISRIMNKNLQMNFNDYINSIRISNACRYIDEGDKTVAEISEMVGFNTVRTFNRAFLKHMGISPREYKHKEIG